MTRLHVVPHELRVVCVSATMKQNSEADLAAWHLPGGPVGPPATWAVTSNFEGGSETDKRVLGWGGRAPLE